MSPTPLGETLGRSAVAGGTDSTDYAIGTGVDHAVNLYVAFNLIEPHDGSGVINSVQII